MTKITIYRDTNDKITGFECKGHSGYAESGEDIVCAAISILTINFVNSVDALTPYDIQVSEDEDAGFLKATVSDYDNNEIQLLFKSLELGLIGIQEEYSRFLKLTNRRCKP